ncbi:hypothetical protein TWF694_006281 [Orbilia ellipsospora]|uniref:Uncharacterized protein n=1 Tax=Orbilia ellipsospora TaxID=2528407 RepID=A0AAV9XL43_9PEZI
MLLILLFYASLAIAHRPARYHGHIRRRQIDLCGPDPVDCGNGWCCDLGNICVTNTGKDPVCRDTILTNSDGSPMTWSAFPYSYLDQLTATFTDIPPTAPTSPGFTTTTAPPSTSTTPSTTIPTSSAASSTTLNKAMLDGLILLYLFIFGILTLLL